VVRQPVWAEGRVELPDRRNTDRLGAVVLAVVGVQYAVGGSDGVYQAVNLALSCVLMVTANHTYYLDRVKGSQSWNPFEGMKWRKWRKSLSLK
ncbi:hypothetical protein RA989_20975, partial [Mycobacteroides abscessus subsp. massiliense]